jgi:hypothetical protein
MKEKVEELEKRIENLENLKTQKKEKEFQFKEDNKVILDGILEEEKEIKLLKENIEIHCLAEYKINKLNKEFLGGIKIKEYAQVKYDKDKALNWAKEKNMFLLLDQKAFEKAADSLNLDFVETDEKLLKVTYPKKIKLEG